MLWAAAGYAAEASGPPNTSPEKSKLIALAAAKFPNLTRAERAMLWFADVDNIKRGEFAIAGISADPKDPSNDPAHADQWDNSREIRESLIDWLCVDPLAIALINPRGIAVSGARVAGGINLSHVRVPFALTLRKCAIAERIRLVGAELPHLDLNGSYVNEIDGKGMTVQSDLNLGDGFHAGGEIRLENVKVDGDLNCGGGDFHHSAVALSPFDGPYKPAIIADLARIEGDAIFSFGFRSEGAVLIRFASIAGTLDMFGARMLNRGNVAFRARGTIFGGVLIGNPLAELEWGNFEADGTVDFIASRSRAFFAVSQAQFLGAPGDGHGFVASQMTVEGPFLWQNVQLTNGAQLDVRGARVGALIDEESSWPAPGNLLIDGFTYTGFAPTSPASAPADAGTRLRWLRLQSGFHPQSYRQLARILREGGDESGATEVLIAGEDLNYQRFGLPGRMWGGFLNTTIGYGHRPLRAIVWSMAVVLLGWAVVRIGLRAGVMRRTWPENLPPSEPIRFYERLSPLLYSLDVFVPFVNLHQEQYWWPDAGASGECRVMGWKLRVNGGLLRIYLWLQMIAGWLLSAIFIAGVTGLIRND